MFDEMNITQSLFNWQSNISISTNKESDLFAIINRPMIPSPLQLITYYISGPLLFKLGNNGGQ